MPNDQDKLDWIDPKKVDQNPKNPRAESFYRDKSYLRLVESVGVFGVIVPIIVRRHEQIPDRYRLIDGERRWRAAKDSNLSAVPAYIKSHEQEDTLTTMFQIHMNQKEWSAIDQAHALESLVSEIKTVLAREDISPQLAEKKLLRTLIEKTGMNKANAESRVSFFRWPKEIRDAAYENPDKKYYSYIVEIEDKIVDPALRNYPDLEKTISAEDIRRRLFSKVTDGYVSRAEEVRKASVLVQPHVNNAEQSEARVLLDRFIDEKEFTFSEAYDEYVYRFPQYVQKPALTFKKLMNAISGVLLTLNEGESNDFSRWKPTEKAELREMLIDLKSVVKTSVEKLKDSG